MKIIIKPLRGISGAAEESAVSGASWTSRAVVISDTSLVEGLQNLGWVYPPGGTEGLGGDTAVRGLQFGPGVQVTPQGRYGSVNLGGGQNLHLSRNIFLLYETS
jgi:hypothetical protein